MAEEIHETTQEARAGETPHIMRYVLGISLFLAIAAMTIAWVTGALTSGHEGSSSTADTAAQVQPSSVPQSPDYITDGPGEASVDQQNQRSTAPVE